MDERTKALLRQGREHYERKEFDKADYVLRELLDCGDGFADAFDMLGVIAHHRGDFAAAARYFERAVALNPSYTEALLNLAVTYNDLGQYAAAKAVYSRVTVLRKSSPASLDPFSRGKIANLHADLGHAYAAYGLTAEAIEQFQKALALCPGFPDLRTRLGTIFRESGDLVNARGQYQAAVTASPKYVPARVQLGVTLFFLGDTAGAIEQWHEVLSLDPDNKSAQMYLRLAEAQPKAVSLEHRTG